eukprot:jgi/Mesvir1/13253/Mv12232-RA.1
MRKNRRNPNYVSPGDRSGFGRFIRNATHDDSHANPFKRNRPSNPHGEASVARQLFDVATPLSVEDGARPESDILEAVGSCPDSEPGPGHELPEQAGPSHAVDVTYHGGAGPRALVHDFVEPDAEFDAGPGLNAEPTPGQEEEAEPSPPRTAREWMEWMHQAPSAGGVNPFPRSENVAGMADYTQLLLFAIAQRFRWTEDCIAAVQALHQDPKFKVESAARLGIAMFRDMEKSLPLQTPERVRVDVTVNGVSTTSSFDYISVRSTLEAQLMKESFTQKLLLDHEVHSDGKVFSFNQTKFYNEHPELQQQELPIPSGPIVRVGDTIMVAMLGGTGGRTTLLSPCAVKRVFNEVLEDGTREPRMLVW